MNAKDELEKLRPLMEKANRLQRSKENADLALREFFQGEAATRLQKTCASFDEFKKEVHALTAKLYFEADL